MSTENNLTTERKKELKKEAKEVLVQQEKQKGEEPVIQQESEKSEKVKAAFDKIEFLSLTDEQKGEISVQIKEDANQDNLYIIELVLSLLIATLGLLQNSIAVVVGAMLIAPIMRPITGLSYSIARGDKKVFKSSIFMLMNSIVIAIFLAFLATKIIGFQRETSEILGRVNPNLIDFFIAIFSGMIGVMSFKYEKLSNSIGGVAMAVALIPPLSVVGIELAFGNMVSAFGAFILFITNILAIGLISTIFFWLYGFTPHNKNLQGKVFIRLLLFLSSLILILIPLSFSYIKLIDSAKTSVQIQNHLELRLGLEKVSKVQILKETETVIQARIVLKLAENVSEKEALEILKQELQKVFSKKLHLQIEVIRILDI